MTTTARILAAALALSTLAACSEKSDLVAPSTAEAAAMPSAAAAADAVADITDALDRLMPALAAEPGAAALTALLRQLENDGRRNDADQTRRTALFAMATLERLENDASDGAAADLGAVRLVLEARQ